MLSLWGGAVSLNLYGIWLTHLQFRTQGKSNENFYPVTILKPVKGLESGLQENLSRFLNLDYPNYEVIFSIADDDDPACPVIQKIIAESPFKKVKLILGAVPAGTNPKVNNLIQSYEEAENDWILISDSNVRVEKDYLRKLMADITPDTGIVTGVVSGIEPEDFGGSLEAVTLNTFYAKAMLLAESFGRPCVIGKSMLFKKSTMNRFGGIRTLARYLAEDYMAGEAVRKLGLKVILMRQPVYQHIGSFSFDAFWSRQIRWGRIRKAQAPIVFLLEPFLTSMISGLLGAWALQMAWGVQVEVFCAFHFLFWFLADYSLMKKFDSRSKYNRLVAWMIREILAIPIWMVIAAGNTVYWRGRQLKVQMGGILE